MARIYSNENLPLVVVRELRRLGHDVLTMQESGKAGQAMPDHAVLAFAAEQGRIVVTLNRRHFIRLHADGIPHAGIVVCTYDPDFGALADRISRTLDAHPEMTRELLRVNRSDTPRASDTGKT